MLSDPEDGKTDAVRERGMVCPTSEQIEANAEIRWTDAYGEQLGFACWYPQMGGYVGKCIIHPHNNGCFDAYVWHDGEFPFHETDGPPAMVHHCDARQFIEFGEFAESVCDSQGSRIPEASTETGTDLKWRKKAKRAKR